MNSNIKELISRINDDLDMDIVLNQPVECNILNKFYSQTNGLELPFLEIFPSDKIDPETIPGWYRVGCDGYFSFVLVSKEKTDTPIDLWDHDIGEAPEGSYQTIEELIEEKYLDFLEKEKESRITIISIPEETKKTKVLLTVKKFTSLSNQELLSKLSTVPCNLVTASLEESVNLKRELTEINVKSKLEV